MPLWIWYWVGGGYNWCRANNREEALVKASVMSRVLVVDQKTLHIGTIEEVNKLNRQYASMCD
jgi:hypothetical protein